MPSSFGASCEWRRTVTIPKTQAPLPGHRGLLLLSGPRCCAQMPSPSLLLQAPGDSPGCGETAHESQSREVWGSSGCRALAPGEAKGAGVTGAAGSRLLFCLGWEPPHLVALLEWPVELRSLGKSKSQALHPRKQPGSVFQSSPAWSPCSLPSSLLRTTLCTPLSTTDHSHHGEDHAHSQA